MSEPMRWRWRVEGEHVHVRCFLGAGAHSGTLVFSVSEWPGVMFLLDGCVTFIAGRDSAPLD